MKTLWLDFTGAPGSEESRDISKCSTSSAHLAPADNHLCLVDVCIIIPFVCCFSYIQGCRPVFREHCQSASLRRTGWRDKGIQSDRLEKDKERQGQTLSERKPQRSDESARGGLRVKEMKCAVERGTDEEEEEGRGWRGSCWGMESVSMLIALVWRG